MRYLIAGDDMAVCNLTVQRDFCRAHPAVAASHVQRAGTHQPASFMQPWRAFTRPLPLLRRRVLNARLKSVSMCRVLTRLRNAPAHWWD